jgi:hypothetical protein
VREPDWRVGSLFTGVLNCGEVREFIGRVLYDVHGSMHDTCGRIFERIENEVLKFAGRNRKLIVTLLMEILLASFSVIGGWL